MSVTAKHLLNLFERITEPVFVPKGQNEVFDIPEEYVANRYKRLGKAFLDRLKGKAKKIALRKIILPNLSIPMELGRRDNFSLFDPHHRTLAAKLIDIFAGIKDLEEFQSAVVYARDRLNPYLYIYALSVVIYHRPDTKHLNLPPLVIVFPEKFVNKGFFIRAKEELALFKEEEREIIEIPMYYTASNLDLEHRVAYFREDLGINHHHWVWHLIYPNVVTDQSSIVDKDRRGELFYYMHQQILARYNMERFCNYLPRVTRFLDWRKPIEEGYFPKLDTLVASQNWPSRSANTQLSNINRNQGESRVDIQDLERWRDRILEAIDRGAVVNESGDVLELSESQGIDILGNLIEASSLSINRKIYGDLHNQGHNVISLCHDPDGKYLEPPAVMSDTATAMRDPIFYRWHSFINYLFQEYKNTLPSYTKEQLAFPGVKVTSIEVQTDGASTKAKNKLITFWQQTDIDLSLGMDFEKSEPVFARITRLQHKPFSYKIEVENTGSAGKGTCRIFMAPKFDETGEMLLFRELKDFFVELDKFTVHLKIGKNTITRKSINSSVTISLDKIFKKNAAAEDQDCGCGWPQNMLLCKGTPEGYACQLFVMISDYKKDKVEQKEEGEGKSQCYNAVSYCGKRDKLYPDKRPMGFPFDRQPRTGAETIQQFLTENMMLLPVTVYHNNNTTFKPPVIPDTIPEQNKFH
ncbi:phenoloxidase 1 [Halyomorpha halys]|uniref:phenoloxidase 1 n=1 Tax=Halyomorpha halys TaxID=286706 RepID=UPI0006D4CF4B|nr:phenoloxidase 1-like [Halyomorpha halys]